MGSYNINGPMSVSTVRNISEENEANREERKCRDAAVFYRNSGVNNNAVCEGRRRETETEGPANSPTCMTWLRLERVYQICQSV